MSKLFTRFAMATFLKTRLSDFGHMTGNGTQCCNADTHMIFLPVIYCPTYALLQHVWCVARSYHAKAITQLIADFNILVLIFENPSINVEPGSKGVAFG